MTSPSPSAAAATYTPRAVSDDRRHQILVPVKAFRDAKARLAPELSPIERAALARSMATGVVRAASGLDVAVVCDDDEVADWARSEGATVAWRPERGLNGAVQGAAGEAFSTGAVRVTVVHGDLPLIRSLEWLEACDDPDEVLLVADRHGTGTNVLSVPTAAFQFTYGVGSFARHVAEARRLGLRPVVTEDESLGWDVDVPADLIGLPD